MPARKKSKVSSRFKPHAKPVIEGSNGPELTKRGGGRTGPKGTQNPPEMEDQVSFRGTHGGRTGRR